MSDAVHEAIKMVDLRVDYGDFAAVDSLSLSVPFGEVFGLVGPNGAEDQQFQSVIDSDGADLR